MAVLIEGISVVIRADALLVAFDNDWHSFKNEVPNRTMCADNELVRVGFMVPDDAERYVTDLEARGLCYRIDGISKDIVIVDQLRGPLIHCDWIEFGHINIDGDPAKRIAGCRLRGSTQSTVQTPEGWRFEESLSCQHGFVPSSYIDRSLQFLQSEDGLDLYLNTLTGREVYIGRTDEQS
jgi:hypothetical protein